MSLEKTILKKINANYEQIRATQFAFQNLKKIDHFKENCLLFVLCNNKKLKLNKKELDYLIYNSDLKQINQFGLCSLMAAFSNNLSEDLNLNNQQIDYLIKNSDLKHVDIDQWSALFYAIHYNNHQKLNLTFDQFDYLIKNSNLKQKESINNLSPLMYMVRQQKNLNLNNQQMTYLIKNSDLNHTDHNNWNILMFLLNYYDQIKINLTTDNWQYLINNSNLMLKDQYNDISTLGLFIKNKPDLINFAFEKIFADNITNQDDINKNDILKISIADDCYHQLLNAWESFNTKKSIEKKVISRPHKTIDFKL